MNIAMAVVVSLALAVPSAVLAEDKAQVIPALEVQAQLAQLAPQARTAGSSGATLVANHGNLALKLSVRTKSGGAEIHAHYDDLMIVQQGSATLLTGGTVIDAKMVRDGETTGSGLEGGKPQSITVGDVVIVPAGVPHQLLISPGTLYSALVAKIKE